MCNGSFFLIVTSDVNLQNLYVELLRAHRLPTISVNTYEEALAMTRLIPFGAALFDVECNDDWAALARFRKELHREVPIIALSGALGLDGSYRTLARDLGCAGFVAKPASTALVVRALQRASEGARWSEYIDEYS